MAESSVSDFASLINQQMNSREELATCLAKLEALVILGKGSDWHELTLTTIHEYSEALSDYVDQAIRLNDESLDSLLKSCCIKTRQYG